MTKVPEPVEWLLDFFNIKSIPGEYNPGKLLFAKKPNRTPTKPPENLETGDIVDPKVYVYVPSFYEEPECIGKEHPSPTANDFRKYFASCNIRNASIVEKENMFQRVSGLWNDLSMAFARIVTANQPIDTDRLLNKGMVIDVDEQLEIGQSIIRSHCHEYLGNYDEEALKRMVLGWRPDIKGIPDVIYIGILSWSKCEEIHTLLRQCPCCGAFRIQEKKRGKPRVYCKNKKCRNVFSPEKRDKENKQKKDNRKNKKSKAKLNIIKHIMKYKFEQIDVDKKYVFRLVGKERAEEFFEEVEQRSPENVSSLAEFKRTEGKDW